MFIHYLKQRLYNLKRFNVIYKIFADTDMLSNSIWTQKQDNYGQETFTPISDNGSLVINAVEYLAGGGELIALRTRGTSMRPFIVVEELQKKAETAYRETEKSLHVIVLLSNFCFVAKVHKSM